MGGPPDERDRGGTAPYMADGGVRLVFDRRTQQRMIAQRMPRTRRATTMVTGMLIWRLDVYHPFATSSALPSEHPPFEHRPA